MIGATMSSGLHERGNHAHRNGGRDRGGTGNRSHTTRGKRSRTASSTPAGVNPAMTRLVNYSEEPELRGLAICMC
jgi:hypothetical protein